MYGTTAASIGFNIEILWGSTVIGEADKANASTPGTTSKTDENWYLSATVTCFTNFSGSTAAEVHGQMSLSQSSNGPAQAVGINNKAKGQAVTTSSGQALKLRFTWGTANASDTITLRSYTVEAL